MCLSGCLSLVVSGDLCLEQPVQDGGLPQNPFANPAPTQCQQLTCTVGTKRSEFSFEKRAASVLGGSYQNVILIFNAAQLNTTNPGTISLSICTDGNCTTEANFNPIGCSISDAGITSPSTITFNTTLPNTNETIILRGKHQTNLGTDYVICSTLTLTSVTNGITGAQCSGSPIIVPVIPTSALPLPTNTPPAGSGNLINGASGTTVVASNTLLGYNSTYVGIGIGVVGIIIIIIIIIIVVLVLKRKGNSSKLEDYDYPQVSNESGNKPIPTLSLHEIQSTRMEVARGYDDE